MEKLAIKGGYPVRSGKIYYGRQWIDDDDVQAVAGVLRGDFITCGPKVEEMERSLEAYTGAKYAVAVCNGTAALHCACIAAGIGPGDEVITTPLTFAASANCALYCGATPVFADIDPETYNIDPDSIRAHITSKTKAIIAVDFTGQAVKHKEIREICEEFHLVFIEDAAHAIATKYDGKQVGSLADMTCFSFHPVKTITGGEGGAAGGGELSRCGGVVLSGVLRRGHAQCPPLLLGQPGQRHGERRRLSAGGGGCGAAGGAADRRNLCNLHHFCAGRLVVLPGGVLYG